MVAALSFDYLGKGIYTVPEASRLTRVSTRRIRYWLNGLPSEKDTDSSGRLWQGELNPIEDKLSLGFLDLQEVRFINAFLKTGVSWKLLRSAHSVALRRYGIEHPFCTHRFVTDGVEVIEELTTDADGVAYEEVVKGQRVFRQVIQPLLRELEFSKNELVRWWPLGTDRAVVLDPRRQFGQPITAAAGVATDVLRAASKAGQSVDEISDWYELDPDSVRDAIEFEMALAA